jgi:threonine synthase
VKFNPASYLKTTTSASPLSRLITAPPIASAFYLKKNPGGLSSPKKRKAAAMDEFRRTGRLPIGEEAWRQARALFSAARFGDEETLDWIRRIHGETGMIVDPHTAIGIAAGRAKRREQGTPLVALATAHPAKFGDAVKRATGTEPPLPPALAALKHRPEHCTTLPNQAGALFSFLRERAGKPRAARSAA